MWNDFKAFIARGNVMDLAIGLIIGTAFSKIVSTLVANIVMPPIGLLLGRVDFSSLYINLSSHHYASLAQAQAAGAPVIAYGLFINSVIDFFIIAFVIFLVIRWLTHLKKPHAAPAATTKPCPYCISTIPLQATRCPQCTAVLES
ncbi:MAG: large conductance mechanosensitive channel protein MscL [Firmicutes bacterium]|nr:large conductance mechanosensitive channel protein MscL [Bacillota bacterium]